MTKGPGNGVEFVVPHDYPSGPRLHHGADQLQRRKLARTTVYEIADEYGLAVGLTVSVTTLPVPKLPQQSFKLVSVTVYIANNVITHVYSPAAHGWSFLPAPMHSLRGSHVQVETLNVPLL